ncbi:MAG: tetratricopeptide repeat protein [Planctomycetota bacterium]
MTTNHNIHDAYLDESTSASEMLRRRWHGPAIILAAALLVMALAVASRPAADLDEQSGAVAGLFETLQQPGQWDPKRARHALAEHDRFVDRFENVTIPGRRQLDFRAGRAAERLGEMARAEAYYTRSLDTGYDGRLSGSQFATAKRFVAGRHLEANRLAKAEQAYEDIRNTSREDVSGHDRLEAGKALVEVLEAQGKVNDLEALLDTLQGEADDARDKAAFLLKKGQLGSVEALDDIVTRFPGTEAAAKAHLFKARLRLGRKGPSDPELDDMILKGKIGEDDLASARHSYTEATTIERGDHRGEAYFGKARCLEGLALLKPDQTDQARRLLEQALGEYEQMLRDQLEKDLAGSPYSLLARARTTRINLNLNRTDRALESTERAVNKLSAAAESMLKARAVQMLEEDLRKLFESEKLAERYDKADRMLGLLRKVAPPAVVKQAEAEYQVTRAELLARLLEREAMIDEKSLADIKQTVPELYREAAENFEQTGREVDGLVRQLDFKRRQADQLYASAQFLDRIGRTDDALDDYNRALKVYRELFAPGNAAVLEDMPEAPQARLRAGQCLARTGDNLGSIQRLKDNVVRHPRLVSSWQSRVLIGRNFMTLRQYDKAAKVFDDVVYGKHSGTEDALEVSIRVSPDDRGVPPGPESEVWKEAAFGLARALYKKAGQVGTGDDKKQQRLAAYSEARRRLSEVLQRYGAPQDDSRATPARIVRTRYALADCYQRLATLEPRRSRQNLEAAVELYQEVVDDAGSLSMAPGTSDHQLVLAATLGLARSYREAGEYDKAIHYYNRSRGMAKGPESLQYLLDIANCYRSSGRPEKARNEMKLLRKELARIEKQLRESPGQADDMAAVVVANVKDHVRAIEALLDEDDTR